ncbi:MAG: diadenylate cyclase CdaA [Bacteroidales bacterium]|nr:diadenylate cyclase CdaA [Bacteroidales bacterium]
MIILSSIIQGLPDFHLIDIVDILLVSYLFYEIYKLVKGTNAMRIFMGIVVLYTIWKLVTLLQMKLLSDLMGQFISMGMLALVVVFQPEVRRFLLMLGTKSFIATKKGRFWWKFKLEKKSETDYDAYVEACVNMSRSKTGALIVFIKENELNDIIASGELIEAKVSSALLETIFFKNTPLHDGAVLVKGNKLISARCILPVSSNSNIDPNLGLRHRSAIGVTEMSDAIAVIVSEQTGAISCVKEGEIIRDISPKQLHDFLEDNEL